MPQASPDIPPRSPGHPGQTVPLEVKDQGNTRPHAGLSAHSVLAPVSPDAPPTPHPPATAQSQTCPGEGCRGTERDLSRALLTVQAAGLLYTNPSPPRPASGKTGCWSSVGRYGSDERHSSWSWGEEAPAFTLRGPRDCPPRQLTDRCCLSRVRWSPSASGPGRPGGHRQP